MHRRAFIALFASLFVPASAQSSVAAPDETLDTVDVTPDSSAGGHREFISGMADCGELTCAIDYA